MLELVLNSGQFSLHDFTKRLAKSNLHTMVTVEGVGLWIGAIVVDLYSEME